MADPSPQTIESLLLGSLTARADKYVGQVRSSVDSLKSTASAKIQQLSMAIRTAGFVLGAGLCLVGIGLILIGIGLII